MLFPTLSPEEGWARIYRAIRGSADDEHWSAIEEIVRQEHLSVDLLNRLRQLRNEDREYAPPPGLRGAKLDAYLAGYQAATEARWWSSAEAAFHASSIRSEFHAAFVRGWEDGNAKVTRPAKITRPDEPAS